MKSILGADNVLHRASDILHDESRFRGGVPSAVYYPSSIDDIREIVSRAHREQWSGLVPVGAQTGITGAAVPLEGEGVISLAEMNKIRRVHASPGDSASMLCEAGISLAEIERFLNDPSAWQYPVEGAGQLGVGEWFYPPDPTEDTAQLGGTVATNASGARSFRYGPTRKYVRSATVVMADGDILRLRRGEHPIDEAGVIEVETDSGRQLRTEPLRYRTPPLKNAAGYYFRQDMDALDLFIGSEGTLGIFAELEVSLVRRPKLVSGLSFLPDRPRAFAFASFLRSQGGVTAIEYFDTTALELLRRHADRSTLRVPDLPSDSGAAVYWEYDEGCGSLEERLETWEEALDASGSSLDTTWSGFDQCERRRLRVFRHAIPELVNLIVAGRASRHPSIRKIGTDAVVPHEAFEESLSGWIRLIEQHGIEYVIFGHLGDYHLHCNLLPATPDEMDKAAEVYRRIMNDVIGRGGSVSGEHGIGKLKRDYLAAMVGPGPLAEMAAVKSVFDPEWILAGGNLFTGPGGQSKTSPLPDGAA